jgi:hypothetical protein
MIVSRGARRYIWSLNLWPLSWIRTCAPSSSQQSGQSITPFKRTISKCPDPNAQDQRSHPAESKLHHMSADFDNSNCATKVEGESVIAIT